MREMDGAIILDKPAGITSFIAARKVRGLLGGAKVGHLGTLDPLGTGVLPLLVGRATRLARFYAGHSREYVARIRFGWATSTYDADGDAVTEKRDVELDAAALEAALQAFRGSIRQTPPPVSAKKVDGVRAYKLARRREPVKLEPVAVEIRELELLEAAGDAATVRCLCSAGTYIRSLAQDLGAALGCGAHVQELRRTQVGDFGIAAARTLDDLEALRDAGQLADALLPPTELLPDIPVLRVDAATASRIGHGADFRASPFVRQAGERLVKAVGPDGQLLCLGEAVAPRVYHPITVFL